MMLDAGLIVSRFIHFTAVLALFGGALFPIYVGREAGPPKRWLMLCAAIAVTGGIGWFAFTAAAMSGDAAGLVDPQVWISVIRATDFGPLWLARLGLLMIIPLLAWLAPKRDVTLAQLCGVVLITLAGAGHARFNQGLAGDLHITADAAHLLAAGAWLGGLWPLGRVLTRTDIDPGPVLKRFSGMGYLAVATLLASGLANSWFLVGTVQGLVTTPYGRLVLTKTAIFAAMVALAAGNRFWIMPRLSVEDGRPLRHLRGHVLAEQVLGVLTVAVVSYLGTIQPAMEN